MKRKRLPRLCWRALCYLTDPRPFPGANQPRRARLAQLIGLGTTVALVSLISVLLWVFKGEIGRIYTNDSDVLQELATIMPIIAFILWRMGRSFPLPLPACCLSNPQS